MTFSSQKPAQHRRALLLQYTLAAGLLGGFSVSAAAQTPPPSDSTLTDGPYVRWATPSTVVVQRICSGQPRTDTFRTSGDTVRVPLTCAPNGPTVVIHRTPPTIPAIVPHVERVFAISDLEGEYDNATALLRAAGVLDAQDHWAWGTGHLVLAGDLVDRGTHVTEVLWLVYRLEQEAARAGGAVHYVLGNHDTMLLYGDHRYVASKYKLVTQRLGVPLLDLYGPTTVLGQWMRSKPALVRIDSVLFLHAGISPTFVATSPARALDIPALNALVDSVLYHPDRRKRGSSQSDSLALSVFGTDGPLWYRGYFGRDARTGDSVPAPHPDTLAQALAHYGAKRVVVGHTDVDSIAWSNGNRVIGIDVTFHPNEKDGSIEHVSGLLIEHGQYFRVDLRGRRTPL